MSFRAVLITSLLVVGAFASGCGGAADGGTAPTSPSSRPRPEPPPVSGICAELPAQWAIGQPASARLLEQARVDAGARVARFLRPNQPITMDYSRVRLNLYINAKDVVEFVRCG